MKRIRRGDIETLYIEVKTGTAVKPSSALCKYFNPTTGTYTIAGTATCELGTVYYQLPQGILASIGTYQAHWRVTFPNNDQRTYVQDLEVWDIWPTLPSLNYGDLATLKRYVRNVNEQIKIGNSFDVTCSETDAVQYIRDGERYIDGMLKKYVASSDLPLSSPTDEIRLAAAILGAWFLCNSSFLANAPGELSAAASSLKDMGDKLIEGYINQLKASGDVIPGEHGLPSYRKPTLAFTDRGVGGVTCGELEGVEEDDDVTEHKE